MQRALLGNISSHVRMIVCDWKDYEYFKLRYYLDKEPDEDEKELMSCVLTEFECDIEFDKFYEELIYSTKSFEELDKLQLILFWRNELPV